MPYISLRTNTFLDKKVETTLAVRLSTLVADQLGKDIDWVMADVRGNLALTFGGTAEPTAFVQLKSIGLKQEQCPAFSKAVCDFLETELSIATRRVYVDFTDIKRDWFGWDGTTFG